MLPAKPVTFDKVPAGGFSLEALQKATFDVPAWNDSANKANAQCRSGRIAFAGQLYDDIHETYAVLSVSYVDINQDSTFETVVLVFCHPAGAGQTGPEQVVVLKRGQKISRE